jgi:tetratricopeptide (TPR) repeat protein/predicted aspartyl protease
VKTKTCALAFAAAAALLVPSSAAQAECKLQKVGEVPVTMEGLRAVVSVKINGHDAKLFVDTGAFFSTVSDEAAKAFAMRPTVAPFGLEIRGVGGVSRDARAVRADEFTFANAGFRNIEFLVGGRVGRGEIAGLVGENIFGPFDVEYDFANGAIRFFKPEGCGDSNLAYWSAGQALSRTRLDVPGRFLQQVKTTAEVDGHTIRVTLDSGAPLSTLNRNAASRAGVQISSDGVVAAGIGHGIYGQGYETFLAPFSSFKIGDEEIKNTRLRIADMHLDDSDMLLGMDFFLSHRILVSSSQHRLYFTYNGGPVFRLDQASQRQAQAAATAAPTASDAAPGVAVATATAPPATPTAGEEPKTAADFARRASAFAARREYQPAIDDYGRAIALEPENAKHYRARAMVRLAARQPVLAMADLDESLKREPNDPEALMTRGELYLTTRDPARAKVDFDAAMKLAPANTNLVQQAGVAFARAGFYEDAIRQMDTWIAAHPKDEDLPAALGARCYARAAWGKELDLALADCDVAMRKDKTSLTMQTRALVLLRMDRLDEAIAQYTAAIKAQPRAARALYGRGLAELKKGDKAASDADLAAALAIAPNLTQEYRRFGLAPETGATPAKS